MDKRIVLSGYVTIHHQLINSVEALIIDIEPRRIVGVLGHVADKRAVDLDIIEGEKLQVGEGG